MAKARGRCGELLKELRVRRGLTLREFCQQNGLDPGNYSKIERGLFAPPNAEKLTEYAVALGVAVGSDTHIDLLDRAAVDRGQLPTDILRDEQVLAELPVLFRTLRGKPVPEEKLDQLINIIRNRGHGA